MPAGCAGLPPTVRPMPAEARTACTLPAPRLLAFAVACAPRSLPGTRGLGSSTQSASSRSPFCRRLRIPLVLLRSTSQKANADVVASNVGVLSSPGGFYLMDTSLLLARRSSAHWQHHGHTAAGKR